MKQTDKKYSQFNNKKILIMGLGTLGGGIGAARFFYNAGAKVIVTDLKNSNELKETLFKLKRLKIKYILGRHRVQDFRNAEVIIKGPGVRQNSPYLKIAKENSIKIDTDIGVFFALCPCSIIGVTGTKGKSTIATLIYKLLKTKYKKRIFLAGNMQKSVLDILPKLNNKSLVVLELSSWQLEGLAPYKKSPHIALITNILPDHLNTYKNFDEYFRAKKNIYKYQTPGDFLILNYDDVKLRKIYKNSKKLLSRVKPYSLNNHLPETAVYIKRELDGLRRIGIFYRHKFLCSVNELKIMGKHNLRHILGALTVVDKYKVSPTKAREVIQEFNGISGRLEFIRAKDGIKYFNDTAATNPDAVMAALDALERKTPEGKNQKSIILIAGGIDKNINLGRYKKLAQHINRSVKYLVLLPGTATNKIKKIMRFQKVTAPFILVNDMKRAVIRAEQSAKRGNVVLLSPGAASFNLFKNEFDRGEQFIETVRKL